MKARRAASPVCGRRPFVHRATGPGTGSRNESVISKEAPHQSRGRQIAWRRLRNLLSVTDRPVAALDSVGLPSVAVFRRSGLSVSGSRFLGRAKVPCVGKLRAALPRNDSSVAREYGGNAASVIPGGLLHTHRRIWTRNQEAGSESRSRPRSSRKKILWLRAPGKQRFVPSFDHSCGGSRTSTSTENHSLSSAASSGPA
jgi:hypothetical protein